VGKKIAVLGAKPRPRRGGWGEAGDGMAWDEIGLG
jgi:hypothetical protein